MADLDSGPNFAINWLYNPGKLLGLLSHLSNEELDKTTFKDSSNSEIV